MTPGEGGAGARRGRTGLGPSESDGRGPWHGAGVGRRWVRGLTTAARPPRCQP